jgi:glycerophosphoryl diester phosphodiesterase
VRRALLALTAAAIALTVPVASAHAANPWIQKKRPLNIAHQGGEDEFPANTMFAFRNALSAGADMLELDIGVTKDNKVIVMHDTTVDGKTNGHGTVASKTLRQIRKLDAAYWFAPRAKSHYSHDLARRAYGYRGIATGRKAPPNGFRARDFRVPTLAQVLKAFPRTPINVEIKGRTPDEATEEYVKNAEILARLLKGTTHRKLIVVSFQQAAVDRFHELAPKIDLAPGIDGAANYLLSGGSPGEGVVAFQVPITFVTGGTTLQVTTADNVARAHRDGYSWQNWFSNEDRDAPATWRSLIDMCVDGTMTSRPVAYERVLKRHPRPAACG